MRQSSNLIGSGVIGSVEEDIPSFSASPTSTDSVLMPARTCSSVFGGGVPNSRTFSLATFDRTARNPARPNLNNSYTSDRGTSGRG